METKQTVVEAYLFARIPCPGGEVIECVGTTEYLPAKSYILGSELRLVAPQASPFDPPIEVFRHELKSEEPVLGECLRSGLEMIQRLAARYKPGSPHIQFHLRYPTGTKGLSLLANVSCATENGDSTVRVAIEFGERRVEVPDSQLGDLRIAFVNMARFYSADFLR